MANNVMVSLAKGEALLNEAKKVDRPQFLIGKAGAIIITLAVRIQVRIRIIAPAKRSRKGQ